MDNTCFSTAAIDFECRSLINVDICSNGHWNSSSRYYVKMYGKDGEALSSAFLPRNLKGRRCISFDLPQEHELPYGEYRLALFEDEDCIVVFTAKYAEGRGDRILMKHRSHSDDFGFCLDPEERDKLYSLYQEDLDEYIESEDCGFCDDMDDLFAMQEDEQPQKQEEEQPQKEEDDLPLEDIMAEINEMQGMETIKRDLQNFFCLKKMDMMREKAGISFCPSTNRFHCLFVGNPGTGKTTLAKKLGRIFKKLGMLSKGEVCVHSRTDLVGQYIGGTEDNMTKVFEEARGNVLFIDEAYSLFNGRSEDRGDFGNSVVNALLPILTEQNPDMVVILAGYPKEMKRLMSSNPGLRSRFPHTFVFDDYEPDTLYKIGASRLGKLCFTLTENADARLRELIKEHWAARGADFANARWIENIVEAGIIQALARRLFINASVKPTREDLTVIHRRDVEEGFRRMCADSGSKASKRPIGFLASQ